MPFMASCAGASSLGRAQPVSRGVQGGAPAGCVVTKASGSLQCRTVRRRPGRRVLDASSNPAA